MQIFEVQVMESSDKGVVAYVLLHKDVEETNELSHLVPHPHQTSSYRLRYTNGHRDISKILVDAEPRVSGDEVVMFTSLYPSSEQFEKCLKLYTQKLLKDLEDAQEKLSKTIGSLKVWSSVSVSDIVHDIGEAG